MKKIVLAAASFSLALGALTVVRANSAFDVVDSDLLYTDGTFSTLLPAGAEVQLIWSSDNAYAPANAGQLDAAGYLATASDYLLFQTTTPLDGGWLGDLDAPNVYTSANVGGNPLPSGFVYMRVFQDGTPVAGELYADSAIVPVSNQATNVPPDSPNVVDIAPGGSGGAFPNKTIAAIPEPATLAFCGISSLLMMYRRKMRS